MRASSLGLKVVVQLLMEGRMVSNAACLLGVMQSWLSSSLVLPHTPVACLLEDVWRSRGG